MTSDSTEVCGALAKGMAFFWKKNTEVIGIRKPGYWHLKIFIKDLPEVPQFSDPYIFTEDLNILTDRRHCGIQLELSACTQLINRLFEPYLYWRKTNEKVVFRELHLFAIQNQVPESSAFSGLGVLMTEDMSWHSQLELSLK